MKKFAITLLAVIFILTFTFNTAASNLTAKSYGMGGAYTGLADDATAILYNPAGLSDSGFMGLQFEFGMGASDISKMKKLIDDVEYFSEDFDVDSPEDVEEFNEMFDDFPIVNVQNEIFAGGNFSSFGVGLNVDNEFFTQKSTNVIEAENYTNTSGILSISRDLNTDYKEILGMSYGVNIKTLRTNYTNVKLDKENLKNITRQAKGTGIGLDAGVLVNFTPKLKLGANFKNILAPDYELKGEKEVYTYDSLEGSWEKQDPKDFTKNYSPEQSYRLGASLDVPVINGTIVGDIENYTTSDKTVVHLGVEKRLLFNGLSVRGGMYSPSEEDPTYTLGLGFNLAAFHFDMAVGSNDGFSDNLNGALSLNFQF